MSESSKRVLIVFAHPFFWKSRVNKAMINRVRDLPNVVISDLYEKYPDFHVDVKHEQRLLIETDFLILQHPFYWFASPGIINEWMFVVLEYGFAHGEGGEALKDRPFMMAVSAAGSKAAYQKNGFNNFTLDEFLRPFEQSAIVCGMTYRQPFVIHGTPHLKEEEIDAHAEAYRKLLVSIVG